MDVEFKKPESTRVSDVVWEIPKSFKDGMRVPGRVYATEKLFKELDLQVFDQIANVAMLPGIEKYSFALSDAHSGYGFPIGGVAAFDTDNGGVISPGGIGFDINCLTKDTKIYCEEGVFKRINDIDLDADLKTLDYRLKKVVNTHPINLLKKTNEKKLIKIETDSGKILKCTLDHPILTRNGMVAAEKLKVGDKIISCGFEGVEFEKPDNRPLLSKKLIYNALDDLGITNNGNARTQILNHLKKLNFDRLYLNDPRIGKLLKIMGIVFGDGCIPLGNGKSLLTSVYGKIEDLNVIKRDVEALGFRCGIYSRKRHHIIKTFYGKSEFDFIENSLIVSSVSFSVLLAALGTPVGNKSASRYGVPRWVFNGKKWQKRLFLSAYFGAEMSKPATHNGYNFYGPAISVNKLEKLSDSAIKFLKEIKTLLSEFGIKTSKISRVEGYNYSGPRGDTTGFRMRVESNTKTLISFFSQIGYSYNKEKERLSALAASYLNYIEDIRKDRMRIRQKALLMYKNGKSVSLIVSNLSSENAGKGFIEHSIWSDRGQPRLFGTIRFGAFCRENELGGSGLVYDNIKTLITEDFQGDVFDFTINNKNHNFIANGIVVSNCGVRLIRTDLKLEQVRPKIKELVDSLFKKVPAGVGGASKFKLSKEDFKEIADNGAEWAIKKGYGWKEDLKYTEMGGVADYADSSKISEAAIARGMKQMGTLGSGNHYLEIQYVKPEDIKNHALAKKWGIFPNQVVIMFHCGSRGAGHQIASDYLETFMGVMDRKYKIKVADRELACAPFDSREGEDYYKAMGCGVNIAFLNRQLILHRIREAFSEVFEKDAEKLGMHQIFDVAHNRASLEEHEVDGEKKHLLVHRKGSTGSYPPGRKEIPVQFRKDGSPVLIGGSMETGSYLLVGGPKAGDTFDSTAHGSGRTMSRTKARKLFEGKKIFDNMLAKGIYVKSLSWSGLAEESGESYKELEEVIESVERGGLSSRVCRFTPLGNVKG